MLNDVGIFQGSRREILFMDMQYVPACWEVIAAPDISALATLECKNNSMFFFGFSPPPHFESHHVVSTLPFNCDPRFTTF